MTPTAPSGRCILKWFHMNRLIARSRLDMRSIAICLSRAKFKCNIKVNFWSSQGHWNSHWSRNYWHSTSIHPVFLNQFLNCTSHVDILWKSGYFEKNWSFWKSWCFKNILGKMGVQSLGNFRAWVIKRKNWQGRHQKCSGKILPPSG